MGLAWFMSLFFHIADLEITALNQQPSCVLPKTDKTSINSPVLAYKMKILSARSRAVFASVFVLTLALLIDCSTPPSKIVASNSKSYSTFFGDLENWIQEGYDQYGENKLKTSSTAEVVVGKGERCEDIQTALNLGYTCVYLKKQRFNITEPIVPMKEDTYIISNGAEAFAVERMPAVFDIRSVRYVHLEGLFINGNGLAQKCVDASRNPSQVPVHQIRNCRIWGATLANVDFTGCEDSLIFNCWIDGRIVNDTPDVVTEYGVKIGEFCDGHRTGGQINLIHCLMGFHRKADVFAKNIAQLKLANCLLSSKTSWSHELTAHIIVEGGTGENALQPILELTNCWMEDGPNGTVPNILVRTRMISKLTAIGGMFYTDKSPNVYSNLVPCAETITLIGALFEHNTEYDCYNIIAPTHKLVSLGNTYNQQGIDKANVTTYLIFDRDSTNVETKNETG